jgi:hypothetical protein
MPIPTPGTPIPREAVEARHPDWEDERNEKRLYREACESSGGFAPYTHEIRLRDQWPTDESVGSLRIDTVRRTYLYRHPRERRKFWRRAVMAYCPGVTRKSWKTTSGFLTKQDVVYDHYPAPLTDWMQEVNKRKADWQLYRDTTLIPMTLYYGELPVLLSFPPHDAETRAQQIEQGADLTVTAISPEVTLDWIRDDDDDGGCYRELKYVVERDTTPSLLTTSHTTTRRFHYITQEGWWYIDEVHDKGEKNWPVVASGEWPTDEMPLVIWKATESGVSVVHNAAQLERELYNIVSLIQEIERELTFPQRVMPDPGEKDRASVRATDSDLWADPDATWTPYILAPDAVALERLMAKEENLKVRILEEFGLEFSEGATTGVAQSFKMSKIVRFLSDLSDNIEESEFLTHSLAAQMLGSELDPEARAQRVKEFDARQMERLVENLLMVLEGPAIGNTAQVRLRKQLVAAVDANPDEDTMDEIEKEIQAEVEGESNADEDEMPEGESNADEDEMPEGEEQENERPPEDEDDGAR